MSSPEISQSVKKSKLKNLHSEDISSNEDIHQKLGEVISLLLKISTKLDIDPHGLIDNKTQQSRSETKRDSNGVESEKLNLEIKVTEIDTKKDEGIKKSIEKAKSKKDDKKIKDAKKDGKNKTEGKDTKPENKSEGKDEQSEKEEDNLSSSRTIKKKDSPLTTPLKPLSPEISRDIKKSGRKESKPRSQDESASTKEDNAEEEESKDSISALASPKSRTKVSEKRKPFQNRTIHSQSIAIPLPQPERISPDTVLQLNNEALSKTTLDLIKSKVKGRIEVACELLEKEQDYLRYLCILYHVFKKPMLDSLEKLNITEEQVSVAFCNVEVLISLHAQLLKSLMKQYRNWSETLVIGNIFNKWLPTVTEPYKQYAKQYNDALQTWEDLKDKETVRNFLEQCSASLSENLDIGALTIKPIQRITRDYSLIIERLIKCTPQNHVDYPLLNGVIEDLKIITKDVNDATSELSRFGEGKGKFSPRSNGGYIHKKGANVRNWKHRFMKIENDLGELAYYKSESRKEKKGSIPLNEIDEVRAVFYTDKSNSERKYVFHVVTPERTYFIQCANVVQRMKWIDAIDKARKEAAANPAFDHSKTEENNSSDSAVE